MKVALFIPCYIDQFFPDVGVATVKILKKFDLKIDYPLEQTCCGQPAFNSGYWSEAKVLAEKFLKIFRNYDYIVSPSASCTSMVRVFYPEILKDENTKEITAKFFELTEFLTKILQVESTEAEFNHSVAYHDSCHALRELGIKDSPRVLLRNVKKIKLLEIEDGDRCCGFGGTFAVKFPEISTEMAKSKVDNIIKTGAEFVTSTDSSCLMHIGGYMSKNGVKVKTIHIAQILANF